MKAPLDQKLYNGRHFTSDMLHLREKGCLTEIGILNFKFAKYKLLKKCHRFVNWRIILEIMHTILSGNSAQNCMHRFKYTSPVYKSLAFFK